MLTHCSPCGRAEKEWKRLTGNTFSQLYFVNQKKIKNHCSPWRRNVNQRSCLNKSQSCFAELGFSHLLQMCAHISCATVFLDVTEQFIICRREKKNPKEKTLLRWQKNCFRKSATEAKWPKCGGQRKHRARFEDQKKVVTWSNLDLMGGWMR